MEKEGKEKIEFSKISYSQDGEDMVIDAFYEGNFDYKGFYVDIGAHHPFRFSNTQFFYEKGWAGINIDANPGSMSAFEKFRPDDINLELGVGLFESELDYYTFDEGALNTFSADRVRYLEQNTLYRHKRVLKVKTLPLKQILNRYLPAGQHIDFINIDVEGLDYEVLQSNDWDIFYSDFIAFEMTTQSFHDVFKTNEYSFLCSKGYEIVGKTMRTLIFKRRN